MILFAQGVYEWRVKNETEPVDESPFPHSGRTSRRGISAFESEWRSMKMQQHSRGKAGPCQVPIGPGVMVEGLLTVPEQAHAIVLFVHGSGSSRYSPRNQFVARTLQEAGL